MESVRVMTSPMYDAEESVAGECLLNEWLEFHKKDDSFGADVCPCVFLAISFIPCLCSVQYVIAKLFRGYDVFKTT